MAQAARPRLRHDTGCGRAERNVNKWLVHSILVISDSSSQMQRTMATDQEMELLPLMADAEKAINIQQMNYYYKVRKCKSENVVNQYH